MSARAAAAPSALQSEQATEANSTSSGVGRPRQTAQAARLAEANRAVEARGGTALTRDWTPAEAAEAGVADGNQLMGSTSAQYKRAVPFWEAFKVHAKWGPEADQFVDADGVVADGTFRRFTQYLSDQNVPFGTMDNALKWMQNKYKAQRSACLKPFTKNYVRSLPGVERIWAGYKKRNKGGASAECIDLQAKLGGDLTGTQSIKISELLFEGKVPHLCNYYHVQANAEKSVFSQGAVRSESTRLARPAFLFTRVHEEIGENGMTPMGFVSNGGKLNDAGRPVYTMWLVCCLLPCVRRVCVSCNICLLLSLPVLACFPVHRTTRIPSSAPRATLGSCSCTGTLS